MNDSDKFDDSRTGLDLDPNQAPVPADNKVTSEKQFQDTASLDIAQRTGINALCQGYRELLAWRTFVETCKKMEKSQYDKLVKEQFLGDIRIESDNP
jgi:hypothetical protein